LNYDDAVPEDFKQMIDQARLMVDPTAKYRVITATNMDVEGLMATSNQSKTVVSLIAMVMSLYAAMTFPTPLLMLIRILFVQDRQEVRRALQRCNGSAAECARVMGRTYRPLEDALQRCDADASSSV